MLSPIIEDQYNQLRVKLLRLEQWNCLGTDRFRSVKGQAHLERAWGLWFDYYFRPGS